MKKDFRRNHSKNRTGHLTASQIFHGRTIISYPEYLSLIPLLHPTITMPTAESTPLLGQSSNYYFLNTDKDQPLTNSSDGGLEVEGRPEGSSEAEFQPKMINSRAKVRTAFYLSPLLRTVDDMFSPIASSWHKPKNRTTPLTRLLAQTANNNTLP